MTDFGFENFRLTPDLTNFNHKVGQALLFNKQQEALDLKENSKDIGNRFLSIRRLGDPDNPAETMRAQKTEMVRLARDASKKGLDSSFFEQSLEITDPDEFNTFLSNKFIEFGDARRAIDLMITKTFGGKFETERDDGGNIIGQRNKVTNQLVADPRANSKITSKSFHSDAGKTLADKQLIIELFGESSDQAKRFDELIEVNPKKELTKLDVARSLFDAQLKGQTKAGKASEGLAVSPQIEPANQVGNFTSDSRNPPRADANLTPVERTELELLRDEIYP